MAKKQYTVENFVYNGIFVIPKKGNAPYTAEFRNWTNDPGVAVCMCSDGKARLIPSCQLVGFKKRWIKPETNYRTVGTGKSQQNY